MLEQCSEIDMRRAHSDLLNYGIRRTATEVRSTRSSGCHRFIQCNDRVLACPTTRGTDLRTAARVRIRNERAPLIIRSPEQPAVMQEHRSPVGLEHMDLKSDRP